MSEHDLEKLLGGFAADTLTPEERRLLYRAALEDQELFNALADEQVLKELLADPAVRRRLLQALNQAKTSGAGGSLSWLDWLRRPAGLALAGGLAAAALAVVLGTKIYQDSLRQNAPAVASEETKVPASSTPTSPSAPTPPLQRVQPERDVKDTGAGGAPSAQRETEPAPPAKRERAVPAKPQEESRLGATHDRDETLAQRDKTRGEAETTGKAAEETRAGADTGAPSQRPVQPPVSQQAPSAPAAAGAGPPAVSARALFYAASPTVAGQLSTIEQEPAAPSREAAKQKLEERKMGEATAGEKKRAERSIGLLGKLSADIQPAQVPLGLRYSLLMAGPGGIDMEVDVSTPVGADDAPRLTVQANQDGYLGVYDIRQSADNPPRLFPLEGNGHMNGRKTAVIPLTPLFEGLVAAEPARLLIVFSPRPVDPQDRSRNRPPTSLLTEQIAPGRSGAPAEQAVYVVEAHPGASRIAVEVPLKLRP